MVGSFLHSFTPMAVPAPSRATWAVLQADKGLWIFRHRRSLRPMVVTTLEDGSQTVACTIFYEDPTEQGIISRIDTLVNMAAIQLFFSKIESMYATHPPLTIDVARAILPRFLKMCGLREEDDNESNVKHDATQKKM